jgi:hypothetical protein
MRKTSTISKFLVLILIAAFAFNSIGCTQAIKAMEHSTMQINVKMSDTIYLEPQSLAKNRRIFIRATNTSDFQEVVLEKLIGEKIAKKGFTIVTDPTQADYIVQANVLYFDTAKEGMTADAILSGAIAGGTAGVLIAGSDLKGGFTGAVIGTVLGSLGGAIVGSAWKIDEFFGVIDLRIQERVEGGVAGKMVTDAKIGTSTTLTTERVVKSDYQTYTTRLVAKAKQTNMDRNEAAQVLTERITTQIAGMF